MDERYCRTSATTINVCYVVLDNCSNPADISSFALLPPSGGYRQLRFHNSTILNNLYESVLVRFSFSNHVESFNCVICTENYDIYA